MLRVALAVVLDRAGKQVDRFIEAAFATRHASIERLNVAERHMIVSVAKSGVGRFGDAHCILPLALLKQQPTLQDLHHGGHARMAELERQIPSLTGIDQGFVIVAAAAQTAAFPVISDGQQKSVVEFFWQAQDKIKMRDGGVHGLVSHRGHALCHAQANVVGDGKARARSANRSAREVL